MYDIEFVCSGNKGRSPLAEAFAKKYLSQRNLCGLAKISSSGTLVNLLKNPAEEQVAEMIVPMIPKAIEKGILTREEAFSLQQSGKFREIKDLIFSRIKMKDAGQRKNIMEEKGLSQYLAFDRKPQQTTAREEAQIIFPVDIENYRKVVEIYNNSKFYPKIELLGEIDDPLFVTLNEYRTIVGQIERATIEKIKKTSATTP